MPEHNLPRPMRFSDGKSGEIIRLGNFEIVRAFAASLQWPRELPLFIGPMPGEGEAAALNVTGYHPGSAFCGGRPEIALEIAVRTSDWPKYAELMCRIAGENEYANRRLGRIEMISSRIETPLEIRKSGELYELGIGLRIQPELSELPEASEPPQPRDRRISPEEVERMLAARYDCLRTVRERDGIRCRRVGVGTGETDPLGETVRFPVTWAVTAPDGDELLSRAWMPDENISVGDGVLRGVWTGGGEASDTFLHLGRCWVRSTRKMSFYLNLRESAAAVLPPDAGDDFAAAERELADAVTGITPEPLVVGGRLAPGAAGLAVRWASASGEYRHFIIQGRFPVSRETTVLAENICGRVVDTGRFGVSEVISDISSDAGVKVRTIQVKVFG